MSWFTVAAAGVSLIGGLTASKGKTCSSGTSGYCACITAGTKQAVQSAENIANKPFQGYCVNNAVAGLSCNQKQALGAAQTGGQYIACYQKQAAQQWNPQTQAQYMNPYEKQVLCAQNALATKNYQTQMACLQSKQGMAGAFGGCRSAIGESQLTQNFNLNTNLNNAQGLSAAYNTGLSAFEQNRNYAQGAANQAESNLMQTGAMCQQTQQNKANFNYNQFVQQRCWCKTQNTYLAQTLGQVPKGQYYSGNMTSQTQPAGGGFGGAAAVLGAAGLKSLSNGGTGYNANCYASMCNRTVGGETESQLQSGLTPQLCNNLTGEFSGIGLCPNIVL